jgi:N-acetylglucosamine kinase-like BadF-type ATPase
MRYALGIDGGGSKCDAVLIDETGTAAGWGRGGPVHSYYDAPEVVTASFARAIGDALHGLQDAELWVAGSVPPAASLEAIAPSCAIASILPTSEVETAFASVQEEWGMVVLAGTGSFVYASTPDGASLYVGGWGPTLGDYGSAYAIGLRGLRAACASMWLKARHTSLQQAVPPAYGVKNLHEVFRLVYHERVIGRRQIASLARVVDQEARKGDRIALQCMTTAADELADFAVEVIAQLGIGSLAFPVIAIGSVAQRSRIWWGRMCERIAEVAPAMRPVIPQLPPAVGAALLALRHMGVEWTPALLDQIVETQAPLLAAVEAAEGTGK